MPNIKSAKKRVKTAARNAEKNINQRSAMRTAIRAVREATEAKDADKAQALLPRAFQLVDKAVKRKVIHSNAASRYKSRLTKRISALSA